MCRSCRSPAVAVVIRLAAVLTFVAMSLVLSRYIVLSRIVNAVNKELLDDLNFNKEFKLETV